MKKTEAFLIVYESTLPIPPPTTIIYHTTLHPYEKQDMEPRARRRVRKCRCKFILTIISVSLMLLGREGDHLWLFVASKSHRRLAELNAVPEI